MINVCLTGSQGFIGKNLLNLLIQKDNEINVNPVYSTKPQNTGLALDNPDPLVLSKIDVAVLLGAYSTSHPYASHTTCAQENILRNLLFLEKCLKSGVNNFLIVGSCFEYGLSATKFRFLPSNAPLIPIGSYPSSKAAFSLIALDWAKNNNVNMVYSRLFQVYGKGEKPSRFYPSLLKAALSGANFEMTSGQQIRDILHVEIVVEELFKSIKFTSRLDSSGSTYTQNICSGVPTKMRDFASSVWKSSNATGKLIFGTKKSYFTDLPYIVGKPEILPYP